MSRWSRASMRDERALTVVEVSIAVVLMLAVVPILGPVMVSSMRGGTEFRAHSEVLDELRIQSAAIGRELRSAECIFEPTIPANGHRASSDRLRFTTSANGAVYEVTYEVTGGTLVRSEGTTTRVVGRSVEGTGDAFTHNATPRRTVDIRFRVVSESNGRTDTLQTTIAGRNAWLSLNC